LQVTGLGSPVNPFQQDQLSQAELNFVAYFALAGNEVVARQLDFLSSDQAAQIVGEARQVRACSDSKS
jgi:hypothetical protein